MANNDLTPISDSQLKSSLIRLRQNGKYSDIQLQIGDDLIKVSQTMANSRLINAF